MKKILVMVMAVAAISLSSCGNKTAKECEGADSTCCACKCDTCQCSPCQCGEKECPMEALSEKLEAGDAAGVTAALGEAAQQIETLLKEGKAEEAQKVAFRIQQFINENQEKLAAAQITTDNIVSTIAKLPTTVTETAEAGAEAVKADAETVANAAVEAGKQKANAAVDAAQAKAEEKANEAVETGKQKANEAIDDAAAKAKKKLGL